MPLRSARTCGRFATVIAFMLACAGRPVRAEDWPRWRGPRQDGISQETGLLKEWPQGGPKTLWQVPVRPGYSSVAVVGDRLFTQMQDGKQEAIVCLSTADGTELWRFRYPACILGPGRWFTRGRVFA